MGASPFVLLLLARVANERLMPEIEPAEPLVLVLLAAIGVVAGAVNTVAGETYPAAYTQGVTITISGVAGARTVTYAP